MILQKLIDIFKCSNVMDLEDEFNNEIWFMPRGSAKSCLSVNGKDYEYDSTCGVMIDTSKHILAINCEEGIKVFDILKITDLKCN